MVKAFSCRLSWVSLWTSFMKIIVFMCFPVFPREKLQDENAVYFSFIGKQILCTSVLCKLWAVCLSAEFRTLWVSVRWGTRVCLVFLPPSHFGQGPSLCTLASIFGDSWRLRISLASWGHPHVFLWLHIFLSVLRAWDHLSSTVGDTMRMFVF